MKVYSKAATILLMLSLFAVTQTILVIASPTDGASRPTLKLPTHVFFRVTEVVNPFRAKAAVASSPVPIAQVKTIHPDATKEEISSFNENASACATQIVPVTKGFFKGFRNGPAPHDVLTCFGESQQAIMEMLNATILVHEHPGTIEAFRQAALLMADALGETEAANEICRSSIPPEIQRLKEELKDVTVEQIRNNFASHHAQILNSIADVIDAWGAGKCENVGFTAGQILHTLVKPEENDQNMLQTLIRYISQFDRF